MPTESTSYSLMGAPSPGVADWKGTARYDVLRCIGKGGMGIVYEAFDRERQQHVALKTLLHFSPSALYLFKQEFRTLADVHHKNLVHLYELVMTETDHVFFTMELVTGTDFLTYVQRAGISRPGSSSSDVGSSDVTHREHPSGPRGSREESAARPTSVRKASPADFDYLRPALRQQIGRAHV